MTEETDRHDAMLTRESVALVNDSQYGEEARLTISESGYQMRTNAGAPGEPMWGGDYVRIVSPDGRETGYWTYQEWVDDPVVVMGAIMGSLSGTEVEPVGPAQRDAQS